MCASKYEDVCLFVFVLKVDEMYIKPTIYRQREKKFCYITPNSQPTNSHTVHQKKKKNSSLHNAVKNFNGGKKRKDFFSFSLFYSQWCVSVQWIKILTAYILGCFIKMKTLMNSWLISQRGFNTLLNFGTLCQNFKYLIFFALNRKLYTQI